MQKQKQLAIFLILALLLVTAGVAYAQEGSPMPCSGAEVSGTVIAVDQVTGMVTLEVVSETGEVSQCTVQLGGDTFAHPIVSLLGTYFDDISPENLADALGEVNGYAVQDAEGNWVWADMEQEGAVAVRVLAINPNPDGDGYVIVLAREGEAEPIVILTDDETLVASLNSALETLMIAWMLNEDGTVMEAGDRIAAYHEAGMGFGVLTKLFAIEQASMEACAQSASSSEGTEENALCGVTAEQLVADFQAGTGMGQLFKLYGKPALRGVGHVRKALNSGEEWTSKSGGPPPWAGPKDKGEDVEADLEAPQLSEPDSDNGGPPPWAGPKDKGDKPFKGKPKGKKNK